MARAAISTPTQISELQEKFGEVLIGPRPMHWAFTYLPRVEMTNFTPWRSAGIAEHVEVSEGKGGLPKVVLKHASGTKAEGICPRFGSSCT